MDEKEIQAVFQDARARAIAEYNNLPWFQQHLVISIPLLIIGLGLFQYVLRKWILPVPEEIIFELEDQLPTQGILYHPAIGKLLMMVGTVLLIAFNLNKIF